MTAEQHSKSPRVAKRAVAEAVIGSGWAGWLPRLRLWRGAVVLAYHRLYEAGEQPPFNRALLSATPEEFDAQLRFLGRHFDVVSPAALTQDRDPSARRVVITFDDGYRDNYELALPILRRHRLPATFFLSTGFLDCPRVAWWDELAWIANQSRREALAPGRWLSRPLPLTNDRQPVIEELNRIYKSLPTEHGEEFLDFCADAAGTGRCEPSAGSDLWMTWKMAAELRDAGMTIGGHTVSHPVLGRTRPEDQAREVEECQRRLAEKLDVKMQYFAYPVGLPASFDGVTRDVLRRAGVSLGFSLYGGYLRSGKFDRYDVPRTTIAHWTSPRAFRAVLAFPGAFARW